MDGFHTGRAHASPGSGGVCSAVLKGSASRRVADQESKSKSGSKSIPPIAISISISIPIPGREHFASPCLACASCENRRKARRRRGTGTGSEPGVASPRTAEGRGYFHRRCPVGRNGVRITSIETSRCCKVFLQGLPPCIEFTTIFDGHRQTSSMLVVTAGVASVLVMIQDGGTRAKGTGQPGYRLGGEWS